jgi:hypothetical protein
MATAAATLPSQGCKTAGAWMGFSPAENVNGGGKAGRLRSEDRVAVKPHASPVFHAIQAPRLLGGLLGSYGFPH